VQQQAPSLHSAASIRLTKAMDSRPLLSPIAILPALGALLAGCMVVDQRETGEMQPLDQPPAAVRIKIDRFYPRVRAWYDAVEARYLPLGQALTPQEMDDARRLGVLQLQDVRVVVLELFPMPEDMDLRS
jgi:hypothetical protein